MPRIGTFLNERQKSLLERSIADTCNYFPNKTTLKELALQTGLNEERIYRWFERKRKRIRLREGGGTLYINFMNMLIVYRY